MNTPLPDLRDVLERIKERVEIEGVVGRRVPLRRRGSRLFGLCPFHPEKTPSFTVSPERGFYHCFGCGKHGDVIRFVQETEGLGFWEALHRLADDAGIELPRRGFLGEPALRQRDQVREALRRARDLYRDALRSPEGRAAREYLASRSLRDATLESFGVGWAPAEPGWLVRRLAAAGFGDSILEQAGLAFVPEGGGRLRDRFWERVVFPVADGQGRAVGFGGRYLPGSRAEQTGQGKYVNSPEGPLFQKRRLLYGLDRLAAGLRDRPEDPVLLCEGYLDVLLLHQAGFCTAVAALGTALTEDHARRLRRFDRRVVLVLDPDPAGRRAAFRAARGLVGEGVDVRVAELPEGVDPADMVSSGRTEELSQRLAGARDILDWRLETWSRKPDFGLPAVRARAAQEMAGWVAATGNPALAEVWTRLACDRLGLTEGSFRGLVARDRPPALRWPTRVEPSARPIPSARELLAENERQIVAAVLQDPSLYARHRPELEGLELQDPWASKLLKWCRARREEGLAYDLATALEAFAEDPALSWLESLRPLAISGPGGAAGVAPGVLLQRALRMLPSNRERFRAEERRAAGAASDEELARARPKVLVSATGGPEPGRPSPSDSA